MQLNVQVFYGEKMIESSELKNLIISSAQIDRIVNDVFDNAMIQTQ